MISVKNLDIKDPLKDLLFLVGIQTVQDLLLFNKKELEQFLHIKREQIKDLIKKSLEAQAEEHASDTSLYKGFLHQGGLKETTVSAGFTDIDVTYPKQGITQLIGETTDTDILLKQWISFYEHILLIDCLPKPFRFDPLYHFSVRSADSLDKQSLMIDFLVRDIKDSHIKGIVVRGFLQHLKELDNNRLQRQTVLKHLVKRLERIAEFYTIPILITTKQKGSSTLNQSIKKRVIVDIVEKADQNMLKIKQDKVSKTEYVAVSTLSFPIR